MVYGIPVSKGLSSSMQSKYLTDPRLAVMHELLKSSSQQEAKTPVAGLAKMGSMLANAYGMRNLQNEYQQRGNDFNSIMAQALSEQDPMTALQASNNPDVREYVQQLQSDKLKNQQEFEQKIAFETDPRILAVKERIARAGANKINIGQQEKEEDKAVGKMFGEEYVNLQKAGAAAPGKIAKYDRLDQLLKGVETGTFKGTTTDLKAAAKGLGIDLESMGIKDDVAPIQAAEALINEMTLEMRNPSGGAGMPGAMSDKDREFLQKIPPGIGNTPEARALKTETAKRLAKRDQEVAQLARNYRRQNGKIDEGFYDVLADFSEKNPLFGDMELPSPQKPANSPGAIKFLGYE